MFKKIFLLGAISTVLSVCSTNAAIYALFNAANGFGPPSDTLWANPNGSLMDGTGFVTMGYFGASIVDADIDTIPELVSQLAGFTQLQTSTPNVSDIWTLFTEPGYIGNDNNDTANITSGNPLLGRRLYCIASNAASVAVANATHGFSVFLIDTIKDDSAVENTYVANPSGVIPILGTISSISHTSTNFGSGTYTTLVMVPEPSAILLGAFGALGLLRRRRN